MATYPGAKEIANDGQRDVIDCGDGRDSFEFDAGLDKVKNCEVKTPL
jgi:hypothetical protein